MTVQTGTFKPTTGYDDVQVKSDGTFGPTNADMYLCNWSGFTYDLGIRFRNVTIPKNAYIVNAYIQFVCGGSPSNNDTANANIYGEKSASPSFFASYADYWARTRTTAVHAWNAIEHWTAGNTYTTPYINDIITEIVSQSGWASGHDLVIFMQENGSSANALRRVAALEHATYAEAELIVTWVVPDAAETITTAEESIPTRFSQNGLSIQVYEPLIRGKNYLFKFSNEVDKYEHTINAEGGFDTASFSIGSSLTQAEQWLHNGLGRHIEVYNRAMSLVWAGFVNSISINAGSATIKFGPLLDICNRVSIIYTPITGYDPVTGEPTTSDPTVTTITEKIASQQKYGIFEKVLSTGTATLEDITDAQANYLQEHCWPSTGTEVNVGGQAGPISINIECAGYYNMLDVYIYEESGAITTVQASTKIQDVLTEDPNDIFSTDYSKIAFNGVLIPAWEGEQRTAQDVIKSVVVVGDASYNRCIFGIYKDQRAVYETIPMEFEYFFGITDGSQRVFDSAGNIVNPWDVLPGKWLLLTDFMRAKQQLPDLRMDHRAVFIEKVNYSSPFGLQLSGGKIITLAQKLEQLGLGGMS